MSGLTALLTFGLAGIYGLMLAAAAFVHAWRVTPAERWRGTQLESDL